MCPGACYLASQVESESQTSVYEWRAEKPMEVSIPVPGLADEKWDTWVDLIRAFSETGGVMVAQRNLQTLFSGRGHPGFLASVVALKQTMVQPSSLGSQIELIPTIQSLRFAAQELYRRIKCQTSDESPDIIWDDCKTRLIVILEEGCGCERCLTATNELAAAAVTDRAPNLTPHDRYNPATQTLNYSRILAMVGKQPAVSEFSIPDLLHDVRRFAFLDRELREEASLVASCLNVCWLYRILTSFLVHDARALERLICRLCAAFGLHTVEPWKAALTYLARFAGFPEDRHVFRIDLVGIQISAIECIVSKCHTEAPESLKKTVLAFLREAFSAGNSFDFSSLPSSRDTTGPSKAVPSRVLHDTATAPRMPPTSTNTIQGLEITFEEAEGDSEVEFAAGGSDLSDDSWSSPDSEPSDISEDSESEDYGSDSELTE
ncbi:ORF48 [Retroperitoneal fibromatosis-associated herpesvirus]|uniref:ORF48 n=1 Tax=Retroperitoneal fibromatosis-associated herpesvirus TaxID=111469 RepID=U5NIX2_9GAMA|nr:ORF48 [Retroperitoneal fibromatosis-associated herpesvirus]AGY30729.1 ORF48 [Retroperitoneal fibromatosis-associated herpesvirus]